MNDVTNQQPQADAPVPAPATPAPVPATAPRPLPHAIPHNPIRVVDSRSPFAPLAMIWLTTVPRPGDLIKIDLAGRRVSYKVDFVSFDPYDNDAQVALGCSPYQDTTTGVQVDPAKINEFIQRQDQIFQKLEAYSSAIILLGYAGLFAVWGFVKDHLSHRAMVTTAALVGFSLIVYIAWEVVGMIQRSLLQLRFNRAVVARPADQAKAISDFVEQARTAQVRGAGSWLVILVLTVVPGFAGALILLYNAFADLTHLPAWP
jgi:hypothetical protein